MRRISDGLAQVITRKGRFVVATIVVITLALALGLPRLGFVTGEDTIISPSSDVYADNLRFQQAFGGEAMLVLYEGDIAGLFTPENVFAMSAMEEELRATGRFHSVITPLTALRYAQAQLSVAPGMLFQAIARADSPAAEAAVSSVMESELARLGAAGERSLTNGGFVDFLLTDVNGDIRPALAQSFPDEGHAVMIVRVLGNASIDELSVASDTVKEIVERHPIDGFSTVATGAPTLLKSINDYLQGGMAMLGAVAVGVMILVLMLVFRVRSRLLALGVVGFGIVWAFGAMGLVDIPLTMVTISGLPIFIGLGVDFAVQMHSRFEEELARGHEPRTATKRAVRNMGTPLAIAMVAATAGFLALRASPVPMLSDFGLMLTMGAVALVTTAIVIVPLTLFVRERRRPTPVDRRGMRGHVLEHVVRGLTSLGPRAAVLAVVAALALAGTGLALERRIPIETDPERWADQDSAVIGELRTLQEVTGYSSEMGILVTAPNVTADGVVDWMHRFTTAQMEKHSGEIVGVASLPFIASTVTGIDPSGNDVLAMASVAPPDVRGSLISANQTSAAITFPVAPGIDREELLASVEADLAGEFAPPFGVTATPAGLLVVGVELTRGLEDGRATMTFLALGAVALWLAIAFAGVRRALLTMVPVIVAVGLTSLVLWLLQIELTPLTTVAGPLVIAVATEFSVLLVVRYQEEREAGHGPEESVSMAANRIGRAFVASGLTLVGGFSVLTFAALPVLRDFGIVVSLSALVAVIAALVLVPPLLVWAERHPRISGMQGPKRVRETATEPSEVRPPMPV